MRELLLDDVDFRHVLEPAGPLPGLETDDAAHDLGQALKHQYGSGHRNGRLEVIDWRTLRRYGRVLPDLPGQRGVVEASVDQGGNAGQEEDDIQSKVEHRLGSRPHRAVEKIAAHVGVLGQRVGAGEHEQRAVKHIAGVKYPGRRHVHHVALDDLDTDKGHQPDNEPCSSLADPRADAVDHVQELLDIHRSRPTAVSVVWARHSTSWSSSRMVLRWLRLGVRSWSPPRSVQSNGQKPCGG